MLKLRLARHGRNKRPAYRVVVAEHTSPRDGAFVEIVGHYNPLVDPAEFVVKEDRVQHWLGHGAQPTETVHRLLARKGLIAPFEPKPMSKKVLAKKAAAEEAAKQAAKAADAAAKAKAAEDAAKAKAAEEAAAGAAESAAE